MMLRKVAKERVQRYRYSLHGAKDTRTDEEIWVSILRVEKEPRYKETWINRQVFDGEFSEEELKLMAMPIVRGKV